MGLMVTDKVWLLGFLFWGPGVLAQRFFGVFFSLNVLVLNSCALAEPPYLRHPLQQMKTTILDEKIKIEEN